MEKSILNSYILVGCYWTLSWDFGNVIGTWFVFYFYFLLRAFYFNKLQWLKFGFNFAYACYSASLQMVEQKSIKEKLWHRESKRRMSFEFQHEICLPSSIEFIIECSFSIHILYGSLLENKYTKIFNYFYHVQKLLLHARGILA